MVSLRRVNVYIPLFRPKVIKSLIESLNKSISLGFTLREKGAEPA